MGGGGECEAVEVAWESTYVKEVWLTVERRMLCVLSGVGQELQDGPEREAVAQVSMKLRVEAVQVAVAWPSRVQRAATLHLWTQLPRIAYGRRYPCFRHS
eukprot:5884444-Pleurochrysis_carterae.AAC.1